MYHRAKRLRNSSGSVSVVVILQPEFKTDLTSRLSLYTAPSIDPYGYPKSSESLSFDLLVDVNPGHPSS